MITLLRKIRKRLISKNNFSSYLLYAIGEIALVVIGILIALQINNWNEAKKENQQIKKILLEVKANLKSDSSTVAFATNQKMEDLVAQKRVIPHLE